MIAQLKQSNESITIKIDIFTLSILWRGQILVLEFFNRSSNGTSYELIIDKKFYTQDNALRYVFTGTRHIFDYIKENEKEITISQNGVITLIVQILGKRRQLKFMAKEKVLSQQDLKTRFMNHLWRDHEEKIELLLKQNAQLKEKLKSTVKLQNYQQFNETMMLQLQQLKIEVTSLKKERAGAHRLNSNQDEIIQQIQEPQKINQKQVDSIIQHQNEDKENPDLANGISFAQKMQTQLKEDKQINDQILSFMQQQHKVKPEGPQQKVPRAKQIENNIKEIQKQKLKNKQSDHLRSLLYKTAQLLYNNAQYKKSIDLLNQALSIADILHGNNQKIKAQILHGIGVNYYMLKQYNNSLEKLSEALKIKRQMNNARIYHILVNIGLVHEAKNDNRRSLLFFEEALSIKQAQFGDKNLELVYPLIKIVNLLLKQGRYKDAEIKSKLILQIKESSYGKSHYEVARTAYKLANCHYLMGKYSEAIKGYHKSFSIMKDLKIFNQLTHKNIINNFKVILKGLCNKCSLIGNGTHLMAMRLIEDIFQKQFSDTEISELRRQLWLEVKNIPSIKVYKN